MYIFPYRILCIICSLYVTEVNLYIYDIVLTRLDQAVIKIFKLHTNIEYIRIQSTDMYISIKIKIALN